MAKKRIIPKLQFLQSELTPEHIALVTTVQFDKVIEMGNPLSQAKIFEDQMADELIFIDISIYKNRIDKKIAHHIISEAAKKIFLPLTIGGGVETLEDIRHFLNLGADKVCLNTQAFLNKSMIREASLKYGASTLVASIDYKKSADGKNYIYTHGGTEKQNIDPVSWAIELENLGIGEILLTNIEHDGTKKGLDIETIKEVSDAINIPVIASGGCGLASHFSEGFIEGNCSAVAAGTFFSFQDQNIMQTRSQVSNAGVAVRLRT